MTRFAIERTEDGWTLMELKPVEVGFFPEEETARLVLAALTVRQAREAPAVRIEAVEPELEAAAVDPDPPEAAAETAPETAPETGPEEPIAPPPAPEIGGAPVDEPDPNAWTEAELEAAIARIEAGENLSDVAASFDKPMLVLRGKWGAHQRYRREHGEEAPLSDEQARCKLCDKAFVPTSDQPYLCARCRRD